MPIRPVPSAQQRAFELALAEYLGIDPQAASLVGWSVEGGGGQWPKADGRVTLEFHLDGDELLEMLNTGKVREGHAVVTQHSPGETCAEADERADEIPRDILREFTRRADPSTEGVWREAVDLLAEIVAGR